MGMTSGSYDLMGVKHTTATDRYGVKYSDVSVPMKAYSESWSKYSTTTPGYGSPMRNGLPFNKFGYTKTRTIYWNGTSLVGWSGNKPGYYLTSSEGVFSSSFNQGWDGFSPLEETLAIDEALGKALGRAKDQSANWAENIATSKQSISMISGMMIKVLNAYRAVRQGNMAAAAAHLGVSLRGPRRIRNQSKALANGWLELQYGWLPLLSDIYQTTLAIQAKRRQKAPLIRVTGSSARDKSRTTSSSDGTTTTTYAFETKMTAKVILYFRLENEDLRFAAQMGLTNPLALAWELVPFSFVLDWLLPVGSYLSNFDATLGLRFVKGGYTVFSSMKVSGTQTAATHPAIGYTKVVNLSGMVHRLGVNREAYAYVPSQKVPHFKDPTSMQHLANALALLRQQRR